MFIKKSRIIMILLMLGICTISLFLYLNDSISFTLLNERELLNIDSYTAIESKVNKLSSEYLKMNLKNIAKKEISLYQLDSDENMEIVVLLEHESHKPNFLVIDKINNEYNIIFEKENINNYQVHNNSILLLTSKMISPGTGIAKSKYYCYLNTNGQFIKVFSKDKDTIHIDENGEVLEQSYGSIELVDNILHYRINYFNKAKGNYEKTEIYEIYELYENKFSLRQ